GSILETVASVELDTHTAPEAMATPVGVAPTGIAAWTVPFARSMKDTVSSRLSATQIPPNPTATPAGPFPTLMVDTVPVEASIRATVTSDQFVNQSARAPT